MGESESQIDMTQLRISTEVLRALCHPLRMQILEFIDQNEQINVNMIYSTLQLEQSVTSQHLRILRNAGLVQTEREGKCIYYYINYDKVAHATLAIRHFLEAEKAPMHLENPGDS